MQFSPQGHFFNNKLSLPPPQHLPFTPHQRWNMKGRRHRAEQGWLPQHLDVGGVARRPAACWAPASPGCGLGRGNSGCAAREVPRGGCSLPRGVWLGAPPALAAPPGGRQRCRGPQWVLGPIQFSPRCRSGALRAGCPGPWPDARAPQTVPGAVSRVGRLHAQPCPLPAEPCRVAMGSCAAGTGAKGSPSSSPGPRAPGFTGKGGKGAVGWRSQGSGAKGRLLVPPKAAGWWHPGVQGGSLCCRAG